MMMLLNDPTSTEIYTSEHTLYLNDASPKLAQNDECEHGPSEPGQERPAGEEHLGETGEQHPGVQRDHPREVPPPELPAALEIGREHVGTPVTNAQLVCRLLLEQNNTTPNTDTTHKCSIQTLRGTI